MKNTFWNWFNLVLACLCALGMGIVAFDSKYAEPLIQIAPILVYALLTFHYIGEVKTK